MVIESEDFITKLSRTIAAQEQFYVLVLQPEKSQMDGAKESKRRFGSRSISKNWNLTHNYRM